MYEFYPYQKCFSVDSNNNIQQDASGKLPRIFTIRNVDVAQMSLWQSDMVFMPSGHAAATIIQRNWYGKKLVPVDQYYVTIDEQDEPPADILADLITGEMV